MVWGSARTKRTKSKRNWAWNDVILTVPKVYRELYRGCTEVVPGTGFGVILHERTRQNRGVSTLSVQTVGIGDIMIVNIGGDNGWKESPLRQICAGLGIAVVDVGERF